MNLHWKRWTAVVLLAFAATTASANVCVTVCACHHGDTSAPARLVSDDSAQVPSECPVAQLCEFAGTPAVLAAAVTPAGTAPGYVPPLTAHHPYLSDADPPLKPPGA